MQEITAQGGSSIPLFEDLPFSSAVNGCCANLPAAPEVRQELLEIDDLRARHEQVHELVNRVLERVLELKGETHGDAREQEPN
jgi:hypothetical protein